MRRGIRQFVTEIGFKIAPGNRISLAVNRVFQISWKGGDVGIIDAGISGKLIAGQFATFPGTIKWMLQDRSLANQIIQGTQSFFGSHRGTMLRRPVAERKSKNIWPKGAQRYLVHWKQI